MNGIISIKAANPVLCEENWFVEKSLSFLFSDVISCFFSAFIFSIVAVVVFQKLLESRKRGNFSYLVGFLCLWWQ
jgi:hypothetical protein